MTQATPPRPRLLPMLFADGWRVRFRAILGGGLIAWLTSLATLDLMITNPAFYQMSALIAAGGMIGGSILCGWIGRRGKWGFWLTIAGCLLAGLIGGAIAGSALLPGFGTVVGALVGATLPFRDFAGFVIWAACCTVLHEVMARARH